MGSPFNSEPIVTATPRAHKNEGKKRLYFRVAAADAGSTWNCDGGVGDGGSGGSIVTESRSCNEDRAIPSFHLTLCDFQTTKNANESECRFISMVDARLLSII